jgi:O-antigen ligase
MSEFKLAGESDVLNRLLAHMPDLDQSFLLMVMWVSGTVNLLQCVELGGTTGLGIWTTAIAAGVWCLWLVRPYYPRELSRVLLPLISFSLYAALSLAWGGVDVKGLQNLSVSIGFTGFVLLAARECERSPAFAFKLHKALDGASIIAAIAYTITFLLFGEGSDAFVGKRMFFAARPFALFAAVAVARQLARWQAGDWKGFAIGVWLVVLVFLSQSRLAMVACLVQFPLAMCCRGDFKSIARASVMTVFAGSVLIGSIFLSQSMYDRFFAYDAKIAVGGMMINASGRTEMWQTLLDDLRGKAVFFGRGAGAAGRLIDRYFPDLGHPHNDFLRLLYDFGAVGLGWWVLFLVIVMFTMIGGVRACTRQVPDARSRTKDHPDLPLHLAPILALLAIIMSMFTDNSISYIFVMAPLGMLIGVSLSRLRLAGRFRRMPKPRPVPVRQRSRIRLPNWEADYPPGGVVR